MASYSAPGPYTEKESAAGIKLLALFLGLAVCVMGFFGLWLALSAQHARDDANRAAEHVGSASAAMPAAAAVAGGATATPSFAGVAPANADVLAAKHAAFPAELAPAPAGPVAAFTLSIGHGVVSIAPGIRYDAWTFDGRVPAPLLHVRQGQLVKITLVNRAPMAHSVDFHASRVAPNVAFADVAPGATKTFSFRADDPGVFMYHCGTAPVLAHIANGMYGAIVVEPKTMPPADRQYVLVASEWYLNAPGDTAPAALDLVKADEMRPDWVTWNGYAAQYKTHPLTAKPGETVRFWVVDAGPSLNTDFHVVGTILDRAWVNADLRDAPQHGIQTAVVPAGGGGVFDVKIDAAGLYPFVSHSFASVQMGQVGLLKVGE